MLVYISSASKRPLNTWLVDYVAWSE